MAMLMLIQEIGGGPNSPQGKMGAPRCQKRAFHLAGAALKGPFRWEKRQKCKLHPGRLHLAGTALKGERRGNQNMWNSFSSSQYNYAT